LDTLNGRLTLACIIATGRENHNPATLMTGVHLMNRGHIMTTGHLINKELSIACQEKYSNNVHY